MAKELGFPSPNYIKMVMDGDRNVGLRSIDRLMTGLDLKDKEQEYFSYLVFFCQAKTSIEKNYYYGLMSSVRAPFNSGTITTDAYRYYNEWYHWARLEKVDITGAEVVSMGDAVVLRMNDTFSGFGTQGAYCIDTVYNNLVPPSRHPTFTSSIIEKLYVR